jgi:hypothetical protein
MSPLCPGHSGAGHGVRAATAPSDGRAVTAGGSPGPICRATCCWSTPCVASQTPYVAIQTPRVASQPHAWLVKPHAWLVKPPCVASQTPCVASQTPCVVTQGLPGSPEQRAWAQCGFGVGPNGSRFLGPHSNGWRWEGEGLAQMEGFLAPQRGAGPGRAAGCGGQGGEGQWHAKGTGTRPGVGPGDAGIPAERSKGVEGGVSSPPHRVPGPSPGLSLVIAVMLGLAETGAGFVPLEGRPAAKAAGWWQSARAGDWQHGCRLAPTPWLPVGPWGGGQPRAPQGCPRLRKARARPSRPALAKRPQRQPTAAAAGRRCCARALGA